MSPLDVKNSPMPMAGEARVPMPSVSRPGTSEIAWDAEGAREYSTSPVAPACGAASGEGASTRVSRLQAGVPAPRSNPISLADRLSLGGLEAREILRYAIDLAANLAERHRAGVAHGAITAKAVLLSGESARLQDPQVPGLPATRDEVQFAALLRAMARAAVAGERAALGTAFEALCGQYLTAKTEASDQTFKKLVLELKVLRLDYRRRGQRAAAATLTAAMPARAKIAASAERGTVKQPMAEPSAPKHRKVRILIGAAPPAAEPKRYRRTKPRGFLWRILFSRFLDS